MKKKRNRDERDTIFSRMFEIEPGSKKYQEYYDRNPEKEEGDRILRDHPPGVFSKREEQKIIDGLFGLIAGLRTHAGHGYAAARLPEQQDTQKTITESEPEKTNSSRPASAEENLKTTEELARSLGAILTGCTPARQEFFYHTRGRGHWYGEPVENRLPYVFVFAAPMDPEEINRAPAVEQSVEVVKGYYRAANIGLALKHWINAKGYSAVCHMDGESEIILPPAARAAGLGSIGLSGLLVNEKRGLMLRLGAVTTDMPLSKTPQSEFDVLKICRTCGKCANLCPAGAIPAFKDMDPDDGPRVDHEKCFKTWRELGTDCGVCLAGCPFSQKFRKAAKTAAAEGKIHGNEKKEDQEKPNPLKDFMYGN